MAQYFTMPNERWEEINKEEELRLKRENAKISDTITGISTAFTQNNYVSKIYNFAQEAGYSNNTIEDESFINNNNDDRILEVLKQNDLSLTAFNSVKEAKNQEHENWLVGRAVEEKRKLKFMNEHLTANQMTAGSIAGTLFDLDTLLIGPLAGVMAKSGKVSSVAKTTFGIETGGAVVKSQLDENYGLTEAITDMTIGTLIDTSIAKYFSGNLKKDLNTATQDMPSNEEVLQLTWQGQKPITGYAPDTSPIRKQIDEIEERIVSLEKSGNVDEAAKLRFESSRLQEELTKLPEEVKPEYIKNRENFFKNQRRTITGAKQADEQITSIETNIKNSNLKIRNIESKLRAYNDIEASGKELTRGQKAYRTRLKNDLNKEKETLGIEKDKLSQDINYNKIQKAEAEIKELERQVEVIAKDFETFTNDMKETLKDLDSLDDVARTDFVNGMQETMDELSKRYPEETKLARSLFENIKHKKKNTIDVKKLSKKQKAMVLGAVFGGSALMADDGSVSDIGLGHIIMGVVVASVVGPAALKAIKNNGVKGVISDGYEKVKSSLKADEVRMSPTYKGVASAGEFLYDKANSWINSTLREIDGFKDKRLSEFARKLLIDPIDGSARPLEIEKNGMMRAELFKFNALMDYSFKNFIENEGISLLDINTRIKVREEFNKSVSKVLDTGTPSGNKNIDEAAEGIRELFKKAIDNAKEVGVKGVDDVKPSGSYLPRMWNFAYLSRVLNSTDEAGRQAFAKAISNVIVGANKEELASKLTKWFVDDNNISGKKVDDIYERLEEFLKENTTREDIAEATATEADRQSRLKSRIDMNLSDFEEITIKVNGQDTSIKLDDIVERDIYNIVNSYMNQMYGSIALANKGWKTVRAFEDELYSLTKGNPEARETLEAVSDLLLGRPLNQTNTKAQDVVEAVKAITFFKALGLVAFSMLPEAFKSVAYAGLPMTLKNIGKSLKRINKDTEAFRAIEELTGLGTHQARDVLDLKGLDMSEYGEVGAKSWFSRTAIKLQENTARYSGLVRFSDAFQRITALKSATDLANFINGKDVGLIKSRAKAYGINDDVINMFKDDFKFDSNGDLLFTNKDNWSYKKKTVFNDILWKMNQDVTPETLLGTSGRWMKDSNVGKIFSFLLTYPINLFSTQAARDVHFRDTRALFNNFATFTGSYIGMVARYEAQQREYDEDQLIMYSLLNLPAFSLVSSVRSLFDPATVGTLSELKMTMDTISGSTWDELNNK